MNEEIEIYCNSNKWSSISSSISENDAFFSSKYIDINRNIIEGDSECFIYNDKKTDSVVLYPYIKRRIESENLYDIISPYGFGGFITKGCKNTDHEGLICKFHKEFHAYCVETGIVSEFIRFHPFYNNHLLANKSSMKISLSQEVVYTDFTTSHYDINTISSKEVRKKIRKAQRNNIDIIYDRSGEYFDDFIRIYYKTMKSKCAGEFYYFDKDFFKSIQDLFPNNYLLLVAIYEEKVIGGLLILFGDKYSYNFLSCSEQEYRSLGTNDFLQYCAILWSYENGKKRHMLGGGLKKEDSLFQYKAKFSPERKDFYTGQCIHLPDIYNDLSAQRMEQKNIPYSDFYNQSWFPLYRS
ncbi:MAG: GNAT family N-acetyltransferase [Candidatus Electrothrix sp. AR4]|nr:GNAT family N-acetyltransferase [Candidatus Electrothrix sp. AR4]